MALSNIHDEIEEWRELKEEHGPLHLYLGMSFDRLIAWAQGRLPEEMLVVHGLTDR